MQRLNTTVSARPYFPYSIGNKLADPDKMLKWRCKAVARPGATYTWYKNGVMIQSVPGVVEVKRNYLHIFSVSFIFLVFMLQL